ncbi:hypothetical protein LINPERHAP2_LOCUS40119 [Linum perenne]
MFYIWSYKRGALDWVNHTGELIAEWKSDEVSEKSSTADWKSSSSSASCSRGRQWCIIFTNDAKLEYGASNPPILHEISSGLVLEANDEYEKILQQLKHHALGEDESTESISSPVSSSSDLATDLEIQILKRISEILCSNDCLDICIDIFEVMQF